MNNRIKELGLQAADWLDDQESVNTAHAMQLYQEKFAELIVRECVDVADEVSMDDTIGYALLEHFGVEE